MLQKIIKTALEAGASDIHLSNEISFMRCNGLLQPLHLTISDADLRKWAEAYNLSSQWVTTLQIVDGTRLRITTFETNLGISFAIRILMPNIPTIADLNIPNQIFNNICGKKGLYLIAGATGSGKSTTASAIINMILEKQAIHLVTMENPIERVFSSSISQISQQELGTHFSSFADAAQLALHQDPDVIYFSELTDYLTIQTALTLAETGHLVIGTVHSRGAIEAVTRIVDIFESSRQDFVLAQLMATVIGVCWQQLVSNDFQRYPLVEYMEITPAISNHYLKKQGTLTIRNDLNNQLNCFSRIASAKYLQNLGVPLSAIQEALTRDEINQLSLRQ